MKRVLGVIFLLIGLAGTAQAEDIFEEGPFSVTRIDKVCKLQIKVVKENRIEEKKAVEDKKGSAAKENKGKTDKKTPDPLANSAAGETVAVIGLFAGESFYSELFTGRKNIGEAKGKLQIWFGQEKPHDIAFVAGSANKDDHWRWQHLADTKGIVDEMVKYQGKGMGVGISNGAQTLRFSVPLHGAAKAVDVLKKCPAKVEKGAAKEPAKVVKEAAKEPAKEPAKGGAKESAKEPPKGSGKVAPKEPTKGSKEAAKSSGKRKAPADDDDDDE